MTSRILPLAVIVATTILCVEIILPMALGSLAQTLPILAKVAGS